MKIDATLDFPLSPDVLAILNAAQVPGSPARSPFISVTLKRDGTFECEDPIAMEGDLGREIDAPAGNSRMRLLLRTDGTYELDLI